MITGLLLGTLVLLSVWRASAHSARRQQYLDLLSRESAATLDAATESRVVAFCGDCHAMPRADSFVRDAWYDEVHRGYDFYARSGRTDLDPPPMHLTVAYFQSRAPRQLVFPEPEEAQTNLSVAFEVERLTLGGAIPAPPAFSHLRWDRLAAGDPPVLLAADMRHGHIAAVQLRAQPPRASILARLNNPAHVESCDLDGDGALDLVVADLGSYLPDDHDRGRVVWLRRVDGLDRFEETVVASGLGRVADVRPADVDDDGDLDLVVAEFGMFRTGGIVLLRNVAAAGERPRFETQQLDSRPGTTHVPVHDLDGDGHPDFLALVSQEYEQLEAFTNDGDGQFSRRLLWAAPDLTFGSSSIGLVDLDQDRDMDILYTNGDAFDNSHVNPSHGVQWLENLGDLQFAYRRLTDFVGAYCMAAGDLDLDGDLDIIATAFVPTQIRPSNVTPDDLPSILCLEQTEPGVFVRHTLETGSPYYPALELADFDSDGDLDFAVGLHVLSHRTQAPQTRPHRLLVWWNQALAAEGR